MSNINQVIVTGNIGKDPEVRTTASGVTVMQFSLAVSERRKVNDEWTDYTNWIPCVMIGTRAESLAKFLHKGSKVGIVGKLNYSSWKNENGETRSKVELKVNEVELLTPRNQTSQGQNFAQQKDMGTVQAEQDFGVTMEPYEDSDIPF